jgi:hypothetical protein
MRSLAVEDTGPGPEEQQEDPLSSDSSLSPVRETILEESELGAAEAQNVSGEKPDLPLRGNGKVCFNFRMVGN